jgi:uncharacterized protein (TIGR03083 family)
MSTATFNRTATLTAIDQVSARLSEMVLAAPDTPIRVPGSPQWTVAEVYAHVATVAPRYCHGARHEGEWVAHAGDLADLNARQLAVLPTRDLPALRDRMHASLAELGRLIAGFGEDQPSYTFHGGGRISADVALGVLLGEVVVHGYDIARALRRPWPIDPRHVELIMQGLAPVLPGWLATRAQGHTGRHEVRLRGLGVHRFAFEHGRLRMNPPGTFVPHVVISAAPAALLLVVYKRISQWPPILTGRLIAWGPRPWRAFTFAKLFHEP